MKDIHYWVMRMEVVNPDGIIAAGQPDKRHALRLEVSHNNWVVVPLTDYELLNLQKKVQDRVFSSILGVRSA